MSRDQRRLVLVAAVLVAAIAAMLLISRRDQLTLTTPAGFEFVTDIDNWQRTEREHVVASPYNFSLGGDLSQAPLTLGQWRGKDVPQTNLEVFILLEPEQYVYRLYQSVDDPGRYIWLSLIGSRKSKSFHSPQICYDADGWQIETSSRQVALADGAFYTLQLQGVKEIEGSTVKHLVLYFYLWPSYARTTQDGIVLLKVTTAITGSVDEAAAQAEDFLRELFTAGRS